MILIAAFLFADVQHQQPIIVAPSPGPRMNERFVCHGTARREPGKQTTIEFSLKGGMTNWTFSSQPRSVEDRQFTVANDSSSVHLEKFSSKRIIEAANVTAIMLKESRDSKGPPPKRIQMTFEYHTPARSNVPFVPAIVKEVPSSVDDVEIFGMPVIWIGACELTVSKAPGDAIGIGK